MKLKLSFKVHFYSCIGHYLAFLAISSLVLVLKYIFDVSSEFYLVYMLFSSFLFSIILGAYEYSTIMPTYLNFHPNPRVFWIQSIFANIINSIICLLITLMFNLILVLTKSFDNMLFIAILPFLISFMFAYSVSSCCYALLHKAKYLSIIIIIVLVILMLFFNKSIINWLFTIMKFGLEKFIIWIILMVIIISSNAIIFIRLKNITN